MSSFIDNVFIEDMSDDSNRRVPSGLDAVFMAMRSVSVSATVLMEDESMEAVYT